MALRLGHPPPRAPCTQPLPWTEPTAVVCTPPSTCRIRCVALCLQMLQTLKAQGANALGLFLKLDVFSFPVNAMPQLCKDGTYVAQAMQKLLRRLFGLVPTIGGMLGNVVLKYLCCDIFPIVMDPTYLDDKPDFFAEGGRARPVALFCLEFYTQLVAQFGLRLVINSSRGLKLLQAMFGTALCKLPGAAGEIGVGYHFKLEVRFGGRTFVVRGYGTKHPCWWWPLLFILACYRAQVANMGHCGFGAPGLSVVVGRYGCYKRCCPLICMASSSRRCSRPS